VRASLRGWTITVVRAGLRIALRLLSGVVPQTRSVVVSAFPETEGNGLEVARALLRRYDGRVVWLQEGSAGPQLRDLEEDGLILVPKASLAGVSAYLRAEAVLFTHGLYGSPRPSSRKPLVNLWHGDGPKDVRPAESHGGAAIPSTYFVGSTRLFSGHQAEAFAVPPERILLTGNPRTDQLGNGVRPDQLERLGITGDFVLWMPTFRRTKAVGAVRLWDERAAAERDARDEVAPLVRGLRERGLQLVVKPHPMDADARRHDGVLAVTDEDLKRAGTSLYAVLGQARGLVTDYSSVWVDYLLVDRPMAFLVTDRDSYTRRLLPPDVLDWAPGELVDPAHQPFAEFLADLDSGGANGASCRAEVAAKVGLNPTLTAADDLVTELTRRGVLSTTGTEPG
jgi:hypothetical protein